MILWLRDTNVVIALVVALFGLAGAVIKTGSAIPWRISVVRAAEPEESRTPEPPAPKALGKVTDVKSDKK
ncbi:hypothetical protein LJR029_005488 [Caballeronia sp. LjRoot29]|uniref:hypothetical protein n=1 Tax=Caballeronia sp. LjRoot29 TaxID=3342315 RepID=UPI003ED0C41E